MTTSGEVSVPKAMKRWFSRFDVHMREVLFGASQAFVLRAMGAVLAFALNVAIARLLGTDGAGLYFLALSVVMIGSVVARLGLDNAMLRFVAAGMAKRDAEQVNGVVSLGLRMAGIFGLLIAVLVAALAPHLATHLFSEPDLVQPLVWMSLGILSFSLMTLVAESLKGLKQIPKSMLVSGVIYPVVALLLLWPFVTYWGVAGVSLAYVVATVTAALLGWLWWRRARPAPGTGSFPLSELWNSARPLWIMSGITRGLLPWLPLFLLGIWGTAEDSGVFGAATRLVMLITFFLTAVNTILAPKFAELYAKQNLAMIGKLARRFTLMITLAVLPLFLLLFFAGDFVMGLFGPGFSRGGDVLAILAIGQFVNVLTGSVGVLLMMSGHERDVRNSALFALCLLLVVAASAMPVYGLTGAALASAGAVAGMNLLSAYYVWRRLRIVTLPGGARFLPG